MTAGKLRIGKINRARIEIIPLIDVIFFLLATFVLFTLSLNRTVSLPVNLPVPGKETGSNAVILQVSHEETLYWDRQPISAAALAEKLEFFKREKLALGEEPRIMVSNDENAKFGSAVRVLDEIRKAGIKTFSVETTNARPTGK